MNIQHVVLHTQRFEKCVDRTVLYGNITPRTPNGTFCAAPDDDFVRDFVDVSFIQIAVVMTRYICGITAVPPVVVEDVGFELVLSIE